MMLRTLQGRNRRRSDGCEQQSLQPEPSGMFKRHRDSGMRVGIDAQCLGRPGGAETYTRNIIRALAQVDPEGDYTLFSPQPFPAQILGAERMRRVVVPPRLLFGRVPVSLPLALLRERIDLLHAEFMAPVLTPVRIVLTVYDLSYERYPEFFAT